MIDLEAIKERHSAEQTGHLPPAELDVLLEIDVPVLIDEVERLREALEFYAIEDTYSPCFTEEGYKIATDIEADRGEIARKALNAENNPIKSSFDAEKGKQGLDEEFYTSEKSEPEDKQ